MSFDINEFNDILKYIVEIEKFEGKVFLTVTTDINYLIVDKNNENNNFGKLVVECDNNQMVKIYDKKQQIGSILIQLDEFGKIIKEEYHYKNKLGNHLITVIVDELGEVKKIYTKVNKKKRSIKMVNGHKNKTLIHTLI